MPGYGDQLRPLLCACASVSALAKENGLSYQHQSWYTHSQWQPLAMPKKRGQKVEGQGHNVMTICHGCTLLVKCAAAAVSVGLHVDRAAYASVFM